MKAAHFSAGPPVGATAGATGRADARRAVASARRAYRSRAIVVSAGLAGAIAFCFALSVSLGDLQIPLVDVVPAMFGYGNPDSYFVVHTLRLPRALTGMLVGAAFGLSGAIFQGLARNPLASPDIIGITSGAATAAVFMIVVAGATSAYVSLGAVVGALLTAAAIYALAWKRGVSSYRLVLVGIGVSAALGSVTSYLFTRAEAYQAQRAAVWLTGSLDGRGFEDVGPVAVVVAVAVPTALVLARQLRVLQLGDDCAKGIGTPVERSRGALVLVGVALAAVATASAGPVAFVAFVAPPIARRLTGAAGLTLVPAALTGAALVLASDLVGRRAFAPIELPVGVITGIIGGPYLLWLLARANKVGTAG